MNGSETGFDSVERVRASFAVFVTLAGVTCGLTMLYMGMRSVMRVGGFCAEGGPYVIQQHCPHGVAALMFGGVWGAIIFFGLYVWQTSKHKVPSLAWLGWSALFLSLGWNFLDFGLNPPGPQTSVAWGWLVCAIAFGLMGGLPLLAVAKPTFSAFFGDSGPQPQTAMGPISGTFWTATNKLRQAGQQSATPSIHHSGNSRFVDGLERLAALHRSGALSDAEFEAAKARLISEWT